MVPIKKFDVFLCHNSKDKTEIREIAEKLARLGIASWLDENELRPGLPWQGELERQIEATRSAAVFVGNNGIGPWQLQEIRTLLNALLDRGCPIIPVILKSAPRTPELPAFLKNNTWVDFRESRPEPLGQLYWGITGKQLEGYSNSKLKLSETEYDYSWLEKSLENKLWVEADRETNNCLLEITSRKKGQFLSPRLISKLPCEHLQTIDRLWAKHSNNRFGFRAQKQIWKECNRPLRSSKAWQLFGERVGWRVTPEIQRERQAYAANRTPGSLTKLKRGEWLTQEESLSQPHRPGHFPRIFALRENTKLAGGGWWGITMIEKADVPCNLFVHLFYRLEDCGL